MLYELGKFNTTMTESYDAFDFNGAMAALQNFTSNTLSSFYFDIIKDRLYNDSQNSLSRRTAQTVLLTVRSAPPIVSNNPHLMSLVSGSQYVYFVPGTRRVPYRRRDL